jgi:hypothetical protein
LNNDLLEIAEKKGVQVTFAHPLSSIDFEKKEANFFDVQRVS